MKEINIFRIVFLTLLIILIALGFIKPINIETNILKSILPNDEKSEILENITNKNASRINIIIQADTEENLAKAEDELIFNIEDQGINFEKINYTQILDIYKKHPNNFLSNKTKKDLENKRFDKVTQEKKENIYNPFLSSALLLPLKDDPFMLFTDFVLNLSDNFSNKTLQKDNYYYEILSYNFNPEIALSPTNLNKDVAKLIKIQEDLSKENIKIYLAGAPVHSYYASKNVAKNINIISIISITFIFILIFCYFKSIKPIEPILISIITSIVVGYATCALMFPTIHILTFVFSTTIIGVCIDYSLHFFIEKNESNNSEEVIKKIIKNLSIGLLTTICSFGILLLSNVILLQQIAIFTISGLISTYLSLLLFYPLFYEKIINPNKKTLFNISINRNIGITIFIITICIIASGLGALKFNNDISSLYKPQGTLLEAEKLYSYFMQKNIHYIVLTSNDMEDFQNHLEHEEWIIKNILKANPNAKIEAISKYLPSINTQKENAILIENLYKEKLSSYATFLSKEQQEELLKNFQYIDYLSYNTEEENFLNNFFITPKASMIIVENATEFKDVLADERAEIIDIKGDLSNIIENCTKKCISLLIAVFIIMFLVLSIIYKTKNAIIIMSPSLIASALSLSIPLVLGQEINFFHILSVFLIIGLGIDYSIFRYSKSHNTPDAIFISALTTIVAFSLLTLTSFQVASSMGLVVALGLIFSYLFSIIFIKRES